MTPIFKKHLSNILVVAIGLAILYLLYIRGLFDKPIALLRARIAPKQTPEEDRTDPNNQSNQMDPMVRDDVANTIEALL